MMLLLAIYFWAYDFVSDLRQQMLHFFRFLFSNHTNTNLWWTMSILVIWSNGKSLTVMSSFIFVIRTSMRDEKMIRFVSRFSSFSFVFIFLIFSSYSLFCLTSSFYQNIYSSFGFMSLGKSCRYTKYQCICMFEFFVFYFCLDFLWKRKCPKSMKLLVLTWFVTVIFIDWSSMVFNLSNNTFILQISLNIFHLENRQKWFLWTVTRFQMHFDSILKITIYSEIILCKCLKFNTIVVFI